MKSCRHRMRRREFLRASVAAPALAVAAGAFALPAWASSRSPNEKLNIAVVGAGGRGGRAVTEVRTENFVGLCDVDDQALARWGKEYPNAKLYTDFRKMLTELEKQIDAVSVCTPDHIHMPASVMAMRMGKHCFCQKPMGQNVYEVRGGTEVARQKKLVTQVGTQMHATANYHRVVEWIRAGTIGPVREVHVWCDKGYPGMDRPTDTPPVPEHLHWDLWLGPAPYRPYHPCYLPKKWRRWWDFGSGTLGDMGCHYIDMPYWALKLQHPLSVEAEGPPVHPEGCPAWVIVRWEFPVRGDLPPVKLTWYDGGRQPSLLEEAGLPKWPNGVLFVGTKGMLLADYTQHELFPKETFAGVQPPPQSVPDSIGHVEEWIAACKTGGPTTCNFDYAGPMSEAVLLGTVAYRLGKRLEWDAAALRATNCPEADRLIRREYRQGWAL